MTSLTGHHSTPEFWIKFSKKVGKHPQKNFNQENLGKLFWRTKICLHKRWKMRKTIFKIQLTIMKCSFIFLKLIRINIEDFFFFFQKKWYMLMLMLSEDKYFTFLYLMENEDILQKNKNSLISQYHIFNRIEHCVQPFLIFHPYCYSM